MSALESAEVPFPRRHPLPAEPACRAAPRAGVPQVSSSTELLTTLGQRHARTHALALSTSGFPGLTIDAERAHVQSERAEPELQRLGLAYLRSERAAGALPAEYAAAFNDALRQSERPHCLRAELLGPVSLALLVVDELERPLAYHPALREALLQHLVLRATWLHDQIALTAGSALLCFDEPFLDALNIAFSPLNWDDGIDLLARALSQIPGPCAVAVAGKPPWDLLVTLPVDVIFFDAYSASATLIQHAAAVRSHLDHGGTLGWGLVPADPNALAQERAETLAQRFVRSVEYLADASGLSPVQISRAALISTSARLGHLAPEQATHAAALCAEVVPLLQAHYQLAN